MSAVNAVESIGVTLATVNAVENIVMHSGGSGYAPVLLLIGFLFVMGVLLFMGYLLVMKLLVIVMA
ncbi:hypothetical protein ACLI4Y_14970 [Natrialbaceae archaeon A-CW3]